MIVAQVLTRLLAFVGKELVEVVRRPGALFSLILGPFLIMALFGLGYNNTLNNVHAMLVVDPASGLSKNMTDYGSFYVPGADLVDVVDRRRHRPGRAQGPQAIDVVILVPGQRRGELPGRQADRRSRSSTTSSVRPRPPTPTSWPASSDMR